MMIMISTINIFFYYLRVISNLKIKQMKNKYILFELPKTKHLG